MSNSLVKNQEKQTISTFLLNSAINKRIMDMMKESEGSQFVTSLVAYVNSKPELAECSPLSIFNAAMEIQSLKLSLALNQAHIIKFNNNKTGVPEAKFIPGYLGIYDLACRSSNYKVLNAKELKKGELVSFNYITEESKLNIIEDDDLRESLETTHYIAFYEYLNGFRKTIVWTKNKMIAHADKYSRSFSKDLYEKLVNGTRLSKEEEYKIKNGYWYKDFDGQGIKTMYKQLLKFGMKSIELQKAIESDYESDVEQDIRENKSEDDFIFAEKSNPDPVYQENQEKKQNDDSTQYDLSNENPFV